LDGDINKVILKEGDGKVLKIPSCFANGFMPLQLGTEIVFYSDKTLEESKNDDIRLPANFIDEEIWTIREY
jgi:dTDP-4-dehydrorhamnose 3,5-epimerase-like enzyme